MKDPERDPVAVVAKDAGELIKLAIKFMDGLKAYPTEELDYYDGPGYPRRLSLAITNAEQALLWLGDVLGE